MRNEAKSVELATFTEGRNDVLASIIIAVDLPYCLLANARSRHYRHYTESRRDLRQDATRLLIEARNAQLGDWYSLAESVELEVSILFKQKSSTFDTDNVATAIKPVIDACEDAGILQNDHLIKKVSYELQFHTKIPRSLVRLTFFPYLYQSPHFIQILETDIFDQGVAAISNR